MNMTKTTPTRQDVEQLVAALFAVTSGLERARRQIPVRPHLSVLQVLAWAERQEPVQQVRPKQIAAALGVHRSAVTHQLQALEEAGQVSLTVDPADRRSWFVALTDTGHAELERLTTIGLDRFASFVADWGAREGPPPPRARPRPPPPPCPDHPPAPRPHARSHPSPPPQHRLPPQAGGAPCCRS